MTIYGIHTELSIEPYVSQTLGMTRARRKRPSEEDISAFSDSSGDKDDKEVKVMFSPIHVATSTSLDQ